MAIPRAHELNEYIEFLDMSPPFQSVTGLGSGTTVFASAYARITATGGSVGEADMQHLSQTQEFEVWTRYIEGLNGFMEISWGSRLLSITSPPQLFLDSQSRRWLIIRAEEITEKDLL
jgi:hypothetical protein